MNSRHGLEYLFLLAFLGIVCLCAGLFIPIKASADSGRVVRLVSTQAEANALADGGWTLTGVQWSSSTGKEWRMERDTLATELWKIETFVMDYSKEQADGTWTLTRDNMNQFSVMMDAARRRAARMEDR